jgi:hypothetical protein
MDDMAQTPAQPNAAAFSRRRFLAAFLTLAAYLRLIQPSLAGQDNGNDTVLSGRWLLKRSDLR